MKKFKGTKKMDVIIADAQAQGWEVDRQKFDTEMSDWIYLRDMYNRFKQIALNVTNGHFAVYEPFQEKPTATHMSIKFDDEEWYQEILNLVYESEGGFTLVDGIEINRKHPSSFYIPTQEEINSLTPGNIVKVGFEEQGKSGERMWVTVSEINGDDFTGILDNEPYDLETIKLGDEVKFSTKHILGVYEEEAAL